MKYRLLRSIVVVFAFAMTLNLSADDNPNTEIPRAATRDSGDYEEQVEQITREYRQKLSELQQAYKTAVKQVRVEYINEETSDENPVEPLLADRPSVAVFTQFKPNAERGSNHVLHILTSDGKSLLIPYQFLEQMAGTWRSVPGGIEYTWKGRGSAGSALIDFDPNRPGYRHPNAKVDDLVNAHGSMVVGDPTFLKNGKPSEEQTNGEP
ncbi:hypothetical protein Pla52n_48120 [Stieleria varia]|uniref:Uncharacterized protein n=2 Tax=Stieleria varia TaxID=2528005 RepID=A0A5C6AGV2_9BACT|nr:hypothetical protein Pla52n_48120 [Stieleria varia]